MKSNQMFRTGTVLRLALGPLATAVLIVASSAGFSRQAAAANPAGTFASTSLTGAIGAPGWLQHGPCPETLLPDRVQPVEIRGPEGLLMAIETAEGWSMLRPGPLRIGLVVGQPYRLRIGGIPGRDGEELFPSVRVLAKLAAPPGMAWRFPVEIVIDEDDLESAATGGHVRRIVYASCESEQPDPVPAGWFDVKPGDDALEVARTLGDPVAEVVIGNRQPTPETLP
jgi:hypothetical protein